jgi:hypothetical protein
VLATPRAEALLGDLSTAHLAELRRSGGLLVELAQRLERP